MIFNGQGDDLQRIGGKPSVTWTLKLETRVTEGLLGTPPALARLCATVRAGGWVCASVFCIILTVISLGDGYIDRCLAFALAAPLSMTSTISN